ncbi:MAG: hypothetical protein GX605_04390 [Chloroflexi bacterium]|nr:hypothetical protein [Chloroflexota bacterium]
MHSQENPQSTAIETSPEPLPTPVVAMDLQRRLGEGEPRAWSLHWSDEGLSH